jgi:D-xylose 1-dehydrogenase (NADP+, D-xylono-1,5-lactone-forming)
MNKVRWGLLSTANINRRLIPAIRSSRRGELVAVASRSQAAADAYARQWQIPQAFGSYETMLQSDAVDAVYISLPNHLHAAWSIYAMRQGKHVLCEKPFALSLAEVDEMTATAAATGMVLAEAFMYRHHPQTKIAGDWVQQGRLGDLILIRATFNFAMGSRDNVRLAPEYGGGSLWDVGVYPVSLAQFLTGDTPGWVIGDQWLGPTGVDESFTGQMHYGPAGGGLTAQISCAFRSPWHTAAEIIGSQGRLSLNRPFVQMEDGAQLIFHPEQGEPELIPVPEQSLYAGEVSDMHDAILEGKAPYISLAETRNHVRTVLALYESAVRGRVVSMGVGSLGIQGVDKP